MSSIKCQNLCSNQSHHQAENTLNNWRSDIGKLGYRTVVELWDADPFKLSSAKDWAVYVANNLMNLRFLYKFPDEMVSTCLPEQDDLTSLL
jgi:hypothetical protein